MMMSEASATTSGDLLKMEEIVPSPGGEEEQEEGDVEDEAGAEVWVNRREERAVLA